MIKARVFVTLILGLFIFSACGSSSSDSTSDPSCNGTIDDCGECNGDGSSCLFDACTLPENTIHLMENHVYYHTTSDIAGFQFKVEGATVESASGGEAGSNSFDIHTGSTIVLSFSGTGGAISNPCGNLINIETDEEPTSLSNIVFSDPNAEAIAVSYHNPSQKQVLSPNKISIKEQLNKKSMK